MEQLLVDLLTREIVISVHFVFFLALIISLLKYVIPPLPCDLTLLILSFLVVLKNKPFFPIFIGVTIGGTIGAVIAYKTGLKGKNFDFFSERIKSAIKNLESPFKKSYLFILLFNRFFPGVRPVIFPLAGIYKINFVLVFFLAFLGNILYIIFIYLVVSTAGKELAEIKGLYKIFGVWLEFLILSLVVFLITFAYRKKLFSAIRRNKDVF